MRSYPYILCYEIEMANLLNMWLVSCVEQKVFRLYFSWTRGRLPETLKPSAGLFESRLTLTQG